MSASELLNWVHAIQWVHTTSADEKKSTLNSLKEQVKEAENQNNKIAGIIENTKNLF